MADGFLPLSKDALACPRRKCDARELQDKVIIEVNLTDRSTGTRGKEQTQPGFEGTWLGWESSEQELNANTTRAHFCVSAASFHERFLTHTPPLNEIKLQALWK